MSTPTTAVASDTMSEFASCRPKSQVVVPSELVRDDDVAVRR